MHLSRKLESLDVLGVPLTVLDSYADAVRRILERISRRERTFCVAINPEKILRSQSDCKLRELIRSANFHICDGVGAALAAKLLRRKRVGRITGVQLFLDLIGAAEEKSLNVFLLGASLESNEGACRKLFEKHPRLNIVGNRDGYFRSSEEVVEQINAVGTDMLFVAMGSPCQEQWIAENRERINAPFCMGIGGSLDVVSGKVKWAPAIFRRTGTEFLYRLIREPSRWRRQIVLPMFAIQVLFARFRPAAAHSATQPLPGDNVATPRRNAA